MALNLVTVVIAATPGPSDTTPVEGNYIFSPNGQMWPGVSGSLPIVPQIQQGVLVNNTGSVNLVASDNFALGVLGWDVIINIRGLPTVNFATLQINFSAGATQQVWDILTTNGWIPSNQF